MCMHAYKLCVYAFMHTNSVLDVYTLCQGWTAVSYKSRTPAGFSVLLGRQRLQALRAVVYLVGPAGLRPHALVFGVYRGLTGLKMYNYMLKPAEDDRELTPNMENYLNRFSRKVEGKKTDKAACLLKLKRSLSLSVCLDVCVSVTNSIST